jgi:hypothetical protein
MWWDNNFHTFTIYSDISQSSLRIGGQNFVRVQAGETIRRGDVLYINGTNGSGIPVAYLAMADAGNTMSDIIGISNQPIVTGHQGFVVSTGTVGGVDTQGFTDGDVIYLSNTQSGSFQSNVPLHPYPQVPIGIILAVGVNGRILIKTSHRSIGNVVGPNDSIDNGIPVFSGTDGSTLKTSSVTIDAEGNVSASGFSNTATHDDLTTIYGTGLLTGGLLTVGAGGTFNISAGEGFVVDNHTDPTHPIRNHVVWDDILGIQSQFLSSSNVCNVALDATASVVQQVTPFTSEQARDYIIIGRLSQTTQSVVFVSDLPRVIFNASLDGDDLAISIGTINISGNSITPYSSSLLVNKTSGFIYRTGANYASSKKSPNIVSSATRTSSSIASRGYRDITGNIFLTSGAGPVDPDHWDDGSGTLATVPDNKWTIQRVYLVASATLNVLSGLYGQNLYDSLADAIAAIPTEPFTANPNLADALLRCWIVVKKGTTDLSNTIDNAFITAGKFGDTGISGTGGAGGSGDVIGPGVVTDNAIVRWDGTTGTFIQNSLITIDDSGNLIAPAVSASLIGTASWASKAVTSLSSTSSSFAATASQAATALLASVANVATTAGSSTSASYAVSSSLATLALTSTLSSLAVSATSASIATIANSATSASYSNSSSLASVATLAITATTASSVIFSYQVPIATGSILPVTSSRTLVAITALTSDTSTSASYAPQQQNITVNSITASVISASQISVPTPTEPSDAASKEYVDLLNPQGLQAFLRADVSDIPGYYQMHDLSFPLDESASTILITNLSASQYAFVFASDAVGVTNINAGSFPLHFHAWFSGGGSSALSIIPEFWLRSGSVETFIADERAVVLNKTTDASYVADITLTASIICNATDRAILKFKVASQNQNPTMLMNVDGKTSAGIIIPVPASNFVLRAGDTMTGGLTATSFTGPLVGTASVATTSLTSISASYAVSSSTSLTSISSSNADSASVSLTSVNASNATSASTSLTSISASHANSSDSSNSSISASSAVVADSSLSSSTSVSASHANSSDSAVSASHANSSDSSLSSLTSVSASNALVAVSASNALTSLSASYALSSLSSLTAVSASYALSSSNSLSSLSASSALTSSIANAVTFNYQQPIPTASLVPVTASNSITASFALTSPAQSLITGSLVPITSSWARLAETASFAIVTQVTQSVVSGSISSSWASHSISSETSLTATSASYATIASSALFANSSTSASQALIANSAGTATSATTSTSASYALTANSALTTTSASQALIANSAGTATSASQALIANTAITATAATSATTSTSASYALVSNVALTATSASQALIANTATTATTATSASQALISNTALSSSTSLTSISASQSLISNTATTATSATSASQALIANTATTAASATTATTASYALTSNTSLTATTATSASQALIANTATLATLATTSTSASYALTANSALTATSATTANTANNAVHASSADAASTAVDATHATNADNATSASFATTGISSSFASAATNANFALTTNSSSVSVSSSFATRSSTSISSTSSSFATSCLSANTATSANTASFLPVGSYNITASSATSASFASVANQSFTATTASFVTSASAALFANSASKLTTTVRSILSSSTFTVLGLNVVSCPLSFSVNAGETWICEAFLSAQCSAVTGMKYAISSSVGTFGVIEGYVVGVTNAITAQTVNRLSASNLVNASALHTQVNTPALDKINFSIINPSTSSIISIALAAVAATATASLFQGSYLVAEKIS